MEGNGLKPSFWRRQRSRLIFYPTLILSISLPLTYFVAMPGDSWSGALPALNESESRLLPKLRSDVTMLAQTIGIRALEGHPAQLRQAEDFIRSRFEGLGYQVRAEPYTVDGLRVNNLEVTVEGGAKRNEIVVVGAHYDSELHTPGADDNATAVAALLALAEHFHGTHPARTLRFVAFVNEEPPYFYQTTMGSLVYANNCHRRRENIVAMLSLECLGYFRSEDGSQKYPPPLNLLYPSRGNFIAFVGNVDSRDLTRDLVRTFRAQTHFPSEGAAVPGWVQGSGWSDQWSFWQLGYKAVMVTDTAPFRNPNYHQPTDTADTINYDHFARVTHGLDGVVQHLSQ